MADARTAPRKRAPKASLRPVQARSLATRDALLAAGRSLLDGRDFDALPIASIAAAIGMSVGSFYGRFHDKQAFFAVLQAQVTDEWRQGVAGCLAALEQRKAPALTVVNEFCATAVQLLRADSGFLRSALKHASTHPGSWTPIKQLAADAVEALVVLLAPQLVHLPPKQRAERIRVAMQFVLGTTLNAVLHDPGPLPLASPRLERELARAMALYLGLPPPPAHPTRAARRAAPTRSPQ